MQHVIGLEAGESRDAMPCHGGDLDFLGDDVSEFWRVLTSLDWSRPTKNFLLYSTENQGKFV